MTKRYAFWRLPNGSRCKNLDSEFAPRNVLKEIGKHALLNAHGIPEWKGFRFHDLLTTLRACVMVLDRHGRELNSVDAWTIAKEGMRNIIRRKGDSCTITPAELLTHADAEASKYFRKTKTSYTLVTSLSLASFPAKSIRIGNCSIAPIKGRLGRYALSDDFYRLLNDKRYRFHVDNTGYQHISIKTLGRTVHEGIDQAFEASNLLRGYWNLLVTYGSWSKSFGMIKKPTLAVIHSGPIHTLHHSNGSLVDDMYWYELDYLEDHDLYSTSAEKWEQIEHSRKWMMRRIRNLKYRHNVEQIISLYAVALEQHDLDLAMMQLWSLLERITNTIDARYDDTIKRAAWIFPNHEQKREQLNVLRIKRNRYVHAAKSDLDRQEMAYLIKSIIEPHLIQLIRNDLKVDSIEEYGNILALSPQTVKLNEKLLRLKRARDYLKQRDKHKE